MRIRQVLFVLVVVAVGYAAAGLVRAADTPAAAPAMVAQNAADMKWAPADVLPPGGQMTVVHQNPTTGAIDLLLKATGDWHVPKHWHTPNELVTIIEGTFSTESAGMKHTLTAGGTMYLPSKIPHEAWCKGGCLMLVSGDGPFDVNYVNPADEPATYKAMKEKAAKEKQQ
jgi:anti-sigma factor ChrR (cupin superfamily)